MGEKDRDPQVQDVEAKLQIFGYDGAIYKKVPFFTDFSCRLQKKSIGLVYPQFWCHRPSQ